MNKTKFLFTFLSILATFLTCKDAFSQKQGQARIDSLLTHLSNEREDSNKVNTLLEVSRSLEQDSSVKAREYAMQALTLANKIEYPNGQAKALKGIGLTYYVEGQFFDAAVYFNKSYKIFEKKGDKAGESNMLSNLGALYYSLGADPTEYYKKALQLAKEVHDTNRIIVALMNLGATISQTHKTYNIALGYYLRAIAFLDRSNLRDSNMVSTCYINIGEIYSTISQSDSAFHFYQQALRFTTGEDLPYLLNDFGKLYLKKGNYERAYEYHNKAYKAAIKSSSDIDIVQSLTGIGTTLIAKGENIEGLKKLKQAQKIAEVQKKWKYDLGNIYKDISAAYIKMNKPGDANKYLNLYITIQDTMYSTNQREIKKSQNTIATLKLTFKEQEIDQLNQDAVIKNEQIKSEKKSDIFLLLRLLFCFCFQLQQLGNVIKQRKKKSVPKRL